jgi:hypothetical protein
VTGFDGEQKARARGPRPIGRGGPKEVTGVWAMAPGTSLYHDLDLPSGNYVPLCLLSAPAKLGPHALRGMWGTFES